jgi:alkaline phosphatase
MGVATVTAARIHKGTLEGLETPPCAWLNLDTAPRTSLVRTHSKDNLVTDSAAAITAMMAGEKAPNGVICCRPLPSGEVDTLMTILELAKEKGLGTGIVSNTRITHATPAGLYAHCPDRGQEQSIATAIVPGSGNPRLLDGIDVVLGGGSRFFLPEGSDEGERADGRNLMHEMTQAGYEIVRTADDLGYAVRSGRNKILGLFSPSHMTYELDRRAEWTHREPSLVEMTAAAIAVLSKNPRGFFLVVEGGRIDHALHETNGRRIVAEMLQFDQAVAEGLKLDLDETLVLATSDHDHTMVIAGYPSVKKGVFTEAGRDENGVPYTTILFATGPGNHERSSELTEGILRDPDFRERSGVPTGWDVHGGMDVPLYSWGPKALLENIPGSLDNTEIHSLLRQAVDSM